MTFEEKTVVHALRKMFRGGTLYITTIKDCVKLAGVCPPSRDMEALSALHCMEFAEMDAPFRLEVCKRILGLFTHEGLPGVVTDLFDLPRSHLGETFRLALAGSSVPVLKEGNQ